MISSWQPSICIQVSLRLRVAKALPNFRLCSLQADGPRYLGASIKSNPSVLYSTATVVLMQVGGPAIRKGSKDRAILTALGHQRPLRLWDC